MKKHSPLSQASHLAKMKREQAQHRKEREALFPKPAIVPDANQTSPQAPTPATDTPKPGGKTPPSSH